MLEQLRLRPDDPILDIGCGEGNFSHLARERGARVTGVDACPELVEIAQQNTPSGDFRVGNMENLPFPDSSFSSVTAFNSLHFAGDPIRAIAEAVRVMRPDGAMALAAWGPPHECDSITYLVDLGGLMPPPLSIPQVDFDMTDIETLGDLVVRAGLSRSKTYVVECPWEYSDIDTALRGLLSTGPAAQAINYSGLAEVVDTITESIAPFRRDDGSYLMENTCHYLFAHSKPGVG
ncbi:class I SAM-dependent methyltransferase [Rhodococcus sp. ARP2]|uniref:class I SAM-dependent methyltransferase n=1 Tax=Rhodococcus sp. ARP2 TaxID=1661385 RepID=UPI00069EAA9F|nr:class I SAM-dependent methyltransferase [Rhodococcus sp. ARP2]